MTLFFQAVGAAFVALGLGGIAGRLLYEHFRHAYPRPVRNSRFHHPDDSDF